MSSLVDVGSDGFSTLVRIEVVRPRDDAGDALEREEWPDPLEASFRVVDGERRRTIHVDTGWASSATG